MVLLCYFPFQLYKVITLKRSINGLISVIIFKRTMTNISFNIAYLQDKYLGYYVSMNSFMTEKQMIAVLTYLCTLRFLLRASDWFSNVQRRKCRTLPFIRNFRSLPTAMSPRMNSSEDITATWLGRFVQILNKTGDQHFFVLPDNSEVSTSESVHFRPHLENLKKISKKTLH